MAARGARHRLGRSPPHQGGQHHRPGVSVILTATEPPVFLVQTALCTNFNGIAALDKAGFEVVVLGSLPGWKEDLAHHDARLAAEGRRVACFVSIEVARHIRRHCPHLKRGLFLDEEKLRVSRWSGYLPSDLLLNSSFVLIPWGLLPSRGWQIRQMFGATFGTEIFLRPDSAMKEFAGHTIRMEAFDQEMSAMAQIHHLDPDLLVVVDEGKRISGVEGRCWLMDGEVVTCAPYSHEGQALDPDPTRELMTSAREAARRLEAYENPVVADFVLDEGDTPRLVELNAVSTSGFYPGMDMAALAQAMGSVLV